MIVPFLHPTPLQIHTYVRPASNTQVYVPDADAAWARASVLNAVGGTVYEVRVDGIDDNDEAGESDWGAGDVRRVDLAGVCGATLFFVFAVLLLLLCGALK